MNYRHLFTLLVCCAGLVSPSQAQFLKKIKEKVNKAIGPETATDSSESSGEEKSESSSSKSSSSSSAPKEEKQTKVMWCDTIQVDGQENNGGSGPAGGAAGKDGVTYSLAYSSGGSFRVLYDESSLGLGSNSKGYRIILSEKVNNKSQMVVIENGEVVHTGSEVSAKYIPKYQSADQINDGTADREAAMSKYIVGDTSKITTPKTGASSGTITKIEDEQFEMAMNIARQSDDYKKMSAEEKKEFEEMAKKGMAQHNSMAGTSYAVPASQGGNVAIVDGYFLIVKGKKLGKFQSPPIIDVSKDETKVFAVGTDENGKAVMLINGKKTILDQNKYMAINGSIVRSPDQKRFVYIEQKKMSDEEIDEMTKSIGKKEFKLSYNVLRSDGTSVVVTDHNSSGKFKLTNSGQVVSINERSGEVFADNKPIGKFPVKDGNQLHSDAILIGNDISQIAYYNGDDGSLSYLDGSVKKLNITYPKVVSENGKSYLTWFRKCRNKIYIARYEY